MYNYKSNDGSCQSDKKDFIETWNEIVSNDKIKLSEYIEKCRKLNYKFAHPLDGWTDRKNSIITLCYPYFNDGCVIGDTFIIGHYWEKKKIVCEVIGTNKKPSILVNSTTLEVKFKIIKGKF